MADSKPMVSIAPMKHYRLKTYLIKDTCMVDSSWVTKGTRSLIVVANLMVIVKKNMAVFLQMLLRDRLLNWKFPEFDIVVADLKFQ